MWIGIAIRYYDRDHLVLVLSSSKGRSDEMWYPQSYIVGLYAVFNAIVWVCFLTSWVQRTERPFPLPSSHTSRQLLLQVFGTGA